MVKVGIGCGRVASRGEGEHGRRVEAAREEHAERHVGHQALAHGVARAAGVRPRCPLLRNAPAARTTRPSTAGSRACLSRRAAGGRPAACARRGTSSPAPARTRSRRSDRWRRGPARWRHWPDARTALISEPKTRRDPSQRVVHRLDAEPVASEHQRVGPAVPDRESEHALEVIRRSDVAVLFPGVDEDLGVAAGREAVPPGLELLAEGGVVVDLAVVDDPDRPVFVRQRLMAALEVDDFQPPDAEHGRARRRGCPDRPGRGARSCRASAATRSVPGAPCARRRFPQCHTCSSRGTGLFSTETAETGTGLAPAHSGAAWDDGRALSPRMPFLWKTDPSPSQVSVLPVPLGRAGEAGRQIDTRHVAQTGSGAVDRERPVLTEPVRPAPEQRRLDAERRADGLARDRRGPERRERQMGDLDVDARDSRPTARTRSFSV